MNRGRKTLAQFLIEERRRFPEATGGLNSLLLTLALACKAVASDVGRGALGEAVDDSGADAIFRRCLEVGGHAAAIACGGNVERCAGGEASRYLIVYDALDGVSNADVNAPVGSLFSVLRAPPGMDAGAIGEQALLQPGMKQVAAGYAIYGPATMLVLTVGNGTHGFTLERSIGEFLLTHPGLRIPERTAEFAINASNSRFWEPPVRRYVAECLQGAAGVRGRDFNMRWIASLVAEAHRILLRGGVFLCPREQREGAISGPMRLIDEVNPIGLLIEQAWGRASTGRARALDVVPGSAGERVGFVFGSREEVERIERYHAEDANHAGTDLPLFQARGLFRDSIAA
ncbi:MAG TPA: class 1 fructose-bisphosphatase [Usitatibacter sp.]|nr:class 1 fructose-bisphosphatase [Usitatibacter sp.]